MFVFNVFIVTFATNNIFTHLKSLIMRKTLHLKKGLATAALAFVGIVPTWADGTALIDADFSTEAGTSGWTTVDKSTKTGTTWVWWQQSFNTGSGYVNAVRIARDWDALDNDYYISTAVELEAGKTYNITTQTGKNNGGILKLEAGTSLTDMSTFKEVKTLSPVSTYNPITDETFTYTPETSGTYYFAYHAIQETEGSDYMYLFGFKIAEEGAGGGTTEPTEPEKPETTAILNADFSTEAGTTGWASIDNNADGTTWSYYKSAIWDQASFKYYPAIQYTQSSYSTSVDDYYVSPAVELKKGITYTVTTGAMYEYNAGNVTLELGTSQTDASTFSSKGTIELAKNYADREKTFEVTVDADGTYYFAYHVLQTDGGKMRKTYLTGLKVEAPGTTPDPGTDPTDPSQPDQPGDNAEVYSTDMATDPLWTALDNGANWQYKSMAFYAGGKYNPGMQIVQSSWTSDVNSICATPALELKKGYKYTVTTSTAYDYSNVPHLSLDLGTSNTDASTYSTIAALNPTSGAIAEETNTFTVNEDGTYYLGIRMKETTASMRKAYVLGLKVVGEKSDTPDTPDTPAVTPAAVTDLAGIVNFDEETVTLTWTNPTKDAEGKDLTAKAGAKIYKNDETEPIVTIKELEGETTTDIIHPEPFEGEATFTVKTFIGEKESEAASVKLNLTKPATPAAVTDLMGTPNYDDNTVTLTWTNPTKDADGKDLKDKVSAKIYKGEETDPIKTIDELTGETTTETFAVDPFEGEVVFTVKTFIEDRASEAASVKVDLTKPVPPVVAKELPYTADLTDADAAKEFTVVDNNADNVTWGTTDGINGMTYNSDNATAAANDWIITPALKLEENKNYSISATFSRQGAFDPDKMEIYVGDAAKAEGMTLVASYDITDTENLTNAVRYISAATADKFIGFHIATPNASNGQLSLLSVEVKAIEAATPNAVADLKGEVNSDEKKVTLTWTNPTKDTEGYALVEKVGAKVYENDVLVKTIDELKDATETLEYTPETFAGETTYKVVAFIGEKESEAAETTLNLDDKTGKEVLVKDFSKNFDESEWTIISGGNSGAWKHDYSDVFDFDYKRGGAVEDDWLISPAAPMSAKDRFVVKYKLKTARDYSASVEVTIGEGNTVAAQTQVIASHPNLKQNGFGEFTTEQFSVPEDGMYNVAFHVTDADYYVDVRGVEIYSIGNPTPVTCISELNTQNGAIAYSKANGALFVPAGSKVAVYSANGAVALDTVAGNEAISLNSLAKGMYILKVTSADGKTVSQKIVK